MSCKLYVRIFEQSFEADRHVDERLLSLYLFGMQHTHGKLWTNIVHIEDCFTMAWLTGEIRGQMCTLDSVDIASDESPSISVSSDEWQNIAVPV